MLACIWDKVIEYCIMNTLQRASQINSIQHGEKAGNIFFIYNIICCNT